ncbi:hypothetical protein JYB64_20065 [Algoriphagus aestuarii]|nr:hypothetical protein [Algoriphagus aestuarii]
MGNHLIHTQVLAAGFGNKTAALAGQKSLQEIYYQHLIPVMEQVMDEYDQEGKTIRIETLDLDLGRIPKDLPVDLLQHRLRKALEEQLRKIHVEQTYLNPHQFKDSKSFQKSEKGRPETDWEILIYFLQNGTLPWFASSHIGFSVAQIFQRIVDQNPDKLKSWLSKNPITWTSSKRIAEMLKPFNQNQVHNLFLEAIISENDLKILTHLLSFYGNKRPNLTKDAIRNFYAILIFTSCGKTSDFKTYLSRQFQIISEKSSKNSRLNAEFLIQILWITFHPSVNSKSFKKKIGQEIVNSLHSIKIASELISGTFWKESIQIINMDFLKHSDLSTIDDLVSKQRIRETQLQKIQNPKEEEKTVIHNAGLVLTAAFLPRFFGNLGLVQSGNFTSQEAKSMAALLLQSMMPEQMEWEEPDLLLNKILCGLEPTETIDFSGDLDPRFLYEKDLLLESMATQWTALKSRSGRMIADGFFAREGILKKVQRGYHLQIQRLAFDILLDRLPWSIGIIKLPWMEELITVEW